MKTLNFVTLKETRVAKVCDNIHYKVKLESGKIVCAKFIDNNDNEWSYIPMKYSGLKSFTLKEIKKMNTNIIDFDSIINLDVLKSHLYKIQHESLIDFYNTNIEFKYKDIIISIHSAVINAVEMALVLQKFLKCEAVKVVEADNTFGVEFDYRIKVIGLTDKDLYYKYFKHDKHQQIYDDMMKEFK